jgi:hypothetical protein
MVTARLSDRGATTETKISGQALEALEFSFDGTTLDASIISTYNHWR